MIQKAIACFWDTRNRQLNSQLDRNNRDTGNRGAVTGGKQMDGFVELLAKVATDMGVPQNCIYTKRNQLPGYFRPTKDWDFLIVSPTNKLIAAIEFKSQVGSFGNNFNNRTEEALRSAVDLWKNSRKHRISTDMLFCAANLFLSDIIPPRPYFYIRRCSIRHFNKQFPDCLRRAPARRSKRIYCIR